MSSSPDQEIVITEESPEESDPVGQGEIASEDVPLAGKTADRSEIVEEKVFGSNISDQATHDDKLGFEPYVTALAKFLRHEKTKGPLTISVEGEWGSGKSSFMLQLADELEKPKNRVDRYRSSQDLPFIVKFNAWRYDKEDAMWAAFALNLIEEVARQSSWGRG